MPSKGLAVLVASVLLAGAGLTGCSINRAGEASSLPTGLPQGPARPQNPVDKGWVVGVVVDGDTIVVTRAGRSLKVRLLGIDTPETVKANTPAQCWGPEASSFLTDLLTNRAVLLERDPTQPAYNQYGRRLEHVWLANSDNTPALLVNWYLVREGFAHARSYGTPTTWQSSYLAAQQTARAMQLGFWSPATCNGNTNKPA